MVMPFHMSQEILDDEHQMATALAEIRNERAEEPIVAAPVQALEAESPSEEAAPEPAPAAAPVASDPNEQLKLVQAELHKARSEIGRVSALNHKYLQSTQEIAALREQLAKVQQAPAPAAETSETVDRLAAVAEQVKDFPELAGIVAAVSDALKQSDKKTEEVARRVAAQVVEPLEPLRRPRRPEDRYKAPATPECCRVAFPAKRADGATTPAHLYRPHPPGLASPHARQPPTGPTCRTSRRASNRPP